MSAGSTAGPTPVEIVAAGVGLPAFRWSPGEAAKLWGQPAVSGSLAACGSDEDSMTLAWSAGSQALSAARNAGIRIDAPRTTSASRGDPRIGCYWGTTSPPFAEGPNLAFLASSLGLPAGTEGYLTCGSPLAGATALEAAWNALASHRVDVALVVASDARKGATGTATETSFGDGAVAFVLLRAGRSGSQGALLLGRSTRMMPVVDRYRGPGELSTHDLYDARLFREAIFLPLVREAGESLASATGEAISSWSITDPDGRLASGAAKALGGTPAGGDIRRTIGDTGAPAPLLGILPSLARSGEDPDGARTEPRSPGLLGLIAYGGGQATAIAMRCGGEIAGVSTALGQLASFGSGSTIRTHVEIMKARGVLAAEVEPVPMGLPPGGGAFVRQVGEVLELTGARCVDCGTIMTPPSIHPSCTGCGGTSLVIVPLTRDGTVVTFVVNHTMPAPFEAPLPLVVIDLDRSGRLMVQGAGEKAGQFTVGGRVHLVLRRYALERSVPVYGWKAVPESDQP